MEVQDFELYMLKFCIKYNVVKDREDFLQNLRIVTLKCIEKYRDNDKGIFPYLEKAYKIVNNEKLSPNEELIQDLISIIHVFSCKIYGLRKYKSKIKEDDSLC